MFSGTSSGANGMDLKYSKVRYKLTIYKYLQTFHSCMRNSFTVTYIHQLMTLNDDNISLTSFVLKFPEVSIGCFHMTSAEDGKDD